jgi:phytoene synthase
VDDAVDETEDPADRERILRGWEREIEAIADGNPQTERGRALGEVVREYQVPIEPLRAILRGVRMDLEKTRYQSYEELKHYCDHVAGAVGVVSLHIFGVDHPEGDAYAHNLGAGLQLINILRDVGGDADRGRIYLPLEALERYGVPPEALFQRRYSPHLTALLEEHAGRAKAYLTQADADAFGPLKPRLAPAEGMRITYCELLRRLSEGGYRIFDAPPRLSHPLRMWLAVKAWGKTWR